MKIQTKILLKRLSVLLPLFLLSVTSVCESNIDREFTEGQEWSINCVPQSTAKVIIGRVEPWKNKIAVHVSIVDIPIPEEAGAIHISEIAHIPFEKTALAGSVGKLLSTGVPPSREFEAGYKQWKEQNGGIYTVPVAKAIALGQGLLDQKRQ